MPSLRPGAEPWRASIACGCRDPRPKSRLWWSCLLHFRRPAALGEFEHYRAERPLVVANFLLRLDPRFSQKIHAQNFQSHVFQGRDIDLYRLRGLGSITIRRFSANGRVLMTHTSITG